MKIIILAIGKEKDFAGHELVREYADRISHYCSCEWKYIPGSSAQDDNAKLVEIIEKEGAGSYTIALDEIGKEYTSVAFAEVIQARMNESVRTLFIVIGGSYGLNDAVRSKARLTLALSKMTFPHQLVRLILAEQLYRAFTIIRGEKYHH
ncbi:MAG TPA: 23S rRNA (pseudouridine(1915)-N(3))-methyltransferase RlmH [Candidatus Paceibacterota bacterium]|jgi:23S rRNA (pseudouridine1915-N3)-methyltransferase|nr:23S rRNA (pseudouridine(1915)-N(3))-methyltransferase RlmH [Candidatus Paceibacterota bacterium]